MSNSNKVVNVTTPPFNPEETVRVFTEVMSREPWVIYSDPVPRQTPNLHVSWDKK